MNCTVLTRYNIIFPTYCFEVYHIVTDILSLTSNVHIEINENKKIKAFSLKIHSKDTQFEKLKKMSNYISDRNWPNSKTPISPLLNKNDAITVDFSENMTKHYLKDFTFFQCINFSCELKYMQKV